MTDFEKGSVKSSLIGPNHYIKYIFRSNTVTDVFFMFLTVGAT